MRVAPFRRRQVRPAQAACDEILTVVSHHAEKRVIGLENVARRDSQMKIPMMLASTRRRIFASRSAEIAVQAGVLQRDRRLRGEQLQHCDPGRREDARGQVVLEVEHADELGLIDQRQAENGTGLALTDVGIRGERGLGRGIVENDALPRAQDVVEDRFRQRRRGHGLRRAAARRPCRRWSWLPPRSAARPLATESADLARRPPARSPCA